MEESRKHHALVDPSMASAHLSVRREVRYAIALEIELSGITQDGQAFCEKTSTIDVSEWGCSFFSTVALAVNDIVSVRRLFREGECAQAEAYFQVVRVERTENSFRIGAWKVDGENVWCAELEKLAQPTGGRLESRATRKEVEAGFDVLDSKDR